LMTVGFTWTHLKLSLGLLGMCRNIDHALLVIGTHQLKVDEGKSAHSFVPLLYFLCDSESAESYKAAFKSLEDIALNYFHASVAPDIVRGDHHWGLVNAVRTIWPSARFVVCRTHAYTSVREASISMNNAQRTVSVTQVLLCYYFLIGDDAGHH